MPDLKTHYLFYVVCNCIFYVLCYRASSAPFSLKQSLKTVLACSLNPLLFVLGGVRDELLEIDGVERVLDVESVSQKLVDNRRLLIATNVEFSMDFPFDPYLLPRGERRLAVVYNHWKGREEADEDEDDDLRSSSSSSSSRSDSSSDGEGKKEKEKKKNFFFKKTYRFWF
jgi:hypothetical protein